MKDSHEELLSTSRDQTAELDELMHRIRETVRSGASADIGQDDGSNIHDSTTDDEHVAAVEGSQPTLLLAEQAEYNRLLLEFMQGLYRHLKRLEEDLARFQHTQERNLDMRLYAAPRRNGHRFQQKGDLSTPGGNVQ